MKRKITSLILTGLFAVIAFSMQAQTGSTCADPTVISALPYSLTDTTTQGSGNDYDNTMACESAFMMGEDYVFSFTASANMNISVKITNTSTGFLGGTGVFVVDGCPDDVATQCVAFATGAAGSNVTIANAELVQGTTYYIIVSTDPGMLGMLQFTDFDIEVLEVFPYDAGVIAISAPTSGCSLTASEIVTVTVKNFGVAEISNVPVFYSLDGGTTEVAGLIDDLIAPGAEASFSFTNDPVDFSAHGTYNITAYTNLANDADATNDEASKTVIHYNAIAAFPYAENFESSNGNWSPTGNTSTWEYGTPAADKIDAAASGTKAWVTNLTGNFAASENSALQSPCFDISSLNLPMIQLKVWYEIPAGIAGFLGGYGRLQYSLDGGATWQTVPAAYGAKSWYTGNGWTGSSAGWITARTSIPALAGESAVSFRIQFTGSSNFVGVDEGIAIDDILILETPPYDAGMIAITAPKGGCGLGNEIVTVRLSNIGTATISNNLSVAYKVNGGTPVVENISAAINPGDTITYSFTQTIDMATAGTYQIEAYTIHPEDTLMVENNTKTITVYAAPTISSMPYSENFETGGGFWSPSGATSSWERGMPIGSIINYAASGNNSWVTNLSGQHTAGEVSYLQSPCFDLSGMQNPYFKMNIWYSTAIMGFATLQGSMDAGQTWFTVGSSASPDWYNAATGWSGNSGDWVPVGHSLDTFAGQSSVQFRIAFNGGMALLGTGEGIAIDDVEILECIPPASAFTSSANLLVVNFTNSSGNADSYLWEFGDGSVSTQENPQYTYATGGTFSVCLTAFNDCASSKVCQNITVTVGIEEYDNNQIIRVFPNPARDYVFVSFEGANQNYNRILRVIDMKGAIVAQYEVMPNQKSMEINVANLSAGIYTINSGAASVRIVVE